MTNKTITAPAAPVAGSNAGALAALALVVSLSSLGTSIVNVGLPMLAEAFSAPFRQVQWVVLAYLLAVTALIVGVGRLGDMVGRRRLLLGGILLFTASSGACGAAPTLWLLVAARAAQGLGAAVMMALSLALVADALPKERTGSAMGLLGTMSAVGTALGPALGGLLIAGFGWRAMFLLNLPLGLLALLLAHRALPLDRPAKSDPFDHVGLLLLALTLTAFTLAMTIGQGSFGLLAAAAAGAALFVLRESKAPFPLIRPAMLRDPVLSSGLVMNLLVMAVMMATLIVGPFYLSHGLGLATPSVALAMSAGPLVAAAAGVPAGRLVDRFGGPRVAFLGLAGAAAGCAIAAATAGGTAAYVAALAIVTAGYALFQAANNALVMTRIGSEERGIASGLLTLSRNLGLVVGASAMGALFASGTGASDVTAAPAEAVVGGMRLCFAVAAGLILAALAIAVASRPDR